MRTKLFVLAILTFCTQLLTACQTTSDASPSEIKEAVKPLEDQRVALLIEFCRGQRPQEITEAEYATWPDDAKRYVTNNGKQYLDAGCKV